MLNIRDLKIDNASLGQKKLLVEVVPAYEYKDKQRTDTITGYRYVVCLVDHHLLSGLGMFCYRHDLIEAVFKMPVKLTLSDLTHFYHSLYFSAVQTDCTTLVHYNTLLNFCIHEKWDWQTVPSSLSWRSNRNLLAISVRG